MAPESATPTAEPAPTGRPVRKLLGTLVGRLVAVLVINGVLAVALIFSAYRVANTLATVHGPAADANAQVLQAMTDAQTGLRGYTVTRDESLLEPFRGAETRSRDQLRTLSASISGEPALGARIARQERAVAAWWTYANQARATAAAGRPAPFAAGKGLFAEVRQANADLDGILRARRLGDRVEASNRLRIGLLVIAITTVAAGVLAVSLGRRTTRELTDPVRRMRSVIVSRRPGQAGTPVDEGSGPLEMRELARELNRLGRISDRYDADRRESMRLAEVPVAALGLLRDAQDEEGLRPVADLLARELNARVYVFRATMPGEFVHSHRAPAEAPAPSDAAARWEEQPPGGLVQIDDTEGEPIADVTDAGEAAGDWPRRLAVALGLRSALVCPVRVGGATAGLIVVGCPEPHAWTQAERHALHEVNLACEHALGELDHRARLMELNSQRNDFISTVNHELRTPLSAVSGYLELLQDGDFGELRPAQVSALAVIERNVARLRGLIEDILILNRLDSGRGMVHAEPLCLRTKVTNALEAVAPQAARRGVSVHVGDIPQECRAIGDRDQIDRALVNIIGNAVKFTSDGGRVDITGTVRDETASIVVTDTGAGIPADELDRIGTRFYRATNVRNDATPGTGLGLAIVGSIMTAHGGQLRLDSEVGVGTRVELVLPRPSDDGADDGA